MISDMFSVDLIRETGESSRGKILVRRVPKHESRYLPISPIHVRKQLLVSLSATCVCPIGMDCLRRVGSLKGRRPQAESNNGTEL